MRRGIGTVASALILLGGCGESGQHSEIHGATGRITIYSTTDTEVFAPVIDDFLLLNPRADIAYLEFDASTLQKKFLGELSHGSPVADLLLSAAMDLQVSLVNDGLAAPHDSANARAIPAWAKWRNEAFGITFEPVVMVYNRGAIGRHAVPRSRSELLDALRSEPDFWKGRIGTYDIRSSSVGYLIASQDARLNPEYDALNSAFGLASVRTFENTAGLLDALENKQILLGYNLLGSYAQRRLKGGARLAIVFPQDYTLAIVRTAVIPKSAPHPQNAHRFLEYLLSERGQRILSSRGSLGAVRQLAGGAAPEGGIDPSLTGPLRPIKLGPGLLVYLDQQKRQRQLDAWTRLTTSAGAADAE